jgi:FkbM family methyltransferase
MIRKVGRMIKRWYSYFRSLGFRETALFGIFYLIKHKSLRMINIANECFYVRTATYDLAPLVSILVNKEFSSIEISNPSVIIDAGANIGASAVYFARRYPNARVFAIEPEQDNYNILLKNINKYNNIFPIKAALWGKKETRVIYDRFTGPSGYTISETNNKTESTGQQVECITISSLIDDYDLHNIDILKMDIEGAEKCVLENSDDWINKVSIIIAELHDKICTEASSGFYLATREFKHFEKNGEKVTAYRNGRTGEDR